MQIVWNSLRSVLASDLLDEGILNSDFLEKCKLDDSLESLVFVLQENYYWQTVISIIPQIYQTQIYLPRTTFYKYEYWYNTKNLNKKPFTVFRYHN